MKLIPEQIDHYHENGYAVVKKLIPPSEYQEFVRHVEANSKGDKSIAGFCQQNNYGRRTFNQHFYGPLILRFLVDTDLKNSLAICLGQPAEGIQTMSFFHDSEHSLHQDQYYYYLLDCISAWITMIDIPKNSVLCSIWFSLRLISCQS